jgi:hypothetical protein
MLRILVERFSVYICQAFCTWFLQTERTIPELEVLGPNSWTLLGQSLKSFPCYSQSPPTESY